LLRALAACGRLTPLTACRAAFTFIAGCRTALATRGADDEVERFDDLTELQQCQCAATKPQ